MSGLALAYNDWPITHSYGTIYTIRKQFLNSINISKVCFEELENGNREGERESAHKIVQKYATANNRIVFSWMGESGSIVG